MHVHSSLGFLHLVLTYPILVQQVILQRTQGRGLLPKENSMILVSPLIVTYVYFSVQMHEFTLETLWTEKSERVLFVSVNELCIHVPKEISMWNDTQHSQLRLGSCNSLDLR